MLVAMSGGVDSSVTAALLQEHGCECIGITLEMWSPDLVPTRDGVCCSLGAVEDARRVAARMKMPHYTLNFREMFQENVVTPFCQAYLVGQTPNPCLECNRVIKFDALWQRARELGAEYLATGHYARIMTGNDRMLLARGLDRRKDQAYVLYVLTQEQLQRTLFPLGGMEKPQVREHARRLGLSVAEKKESQDICFVPDGDYRDFLKERVPEAAKNGEIVDTSGRVLGTHQGIAFYTIGQRRGLGLPGTEPWYVVRLEPETNRVVVGKGEETLSRGLITGHNNWIAIPGLEEPLHVQVKIRYASPLIPAVITPRGADEVQVVFDEPQRAITPGQAAVFYHGEMVLGGGTILSPL